MCTVGAYGLRGCSTSETPIASNARPASCGRDGAGRRRQALALDVRKVDAAALEHAGLLSMMQLMPPPPSARCQAVAPKRRAVDRLQPADDASLQPGEVCRRTLSIVHCDDATGAASLSRGARPARGGRCRCDTACRRSECGRSRRRQCVAACRTLSPSAVTHSTRPPLVTILAVVERVAAWNTLQSSLRLIETGDRVAFARVVGIAGRREHHAERDAPIPLRVDPVERAVDRVLEEIDQIRS